MHIPDGFIDGPTSIAGGVAAAGLVAVSVRKAREEIDDRVAPLAGLTAAFIFAMQMLNFPVAAGTSGHLLGGALAAVLVGPWIGSLCMTVVFAVQALVFADGGLSALGLNVILMGFTTCFVGYGVFRLLQRVLPVGQGDAGRVGRGGRLVRRRRRRRSCSSGTTRSAAPATRRSSTVAGAMVGVHVLIGIGEAIITGLTVGAVASVRPDLVYGARGLVVMPEAAAAPVRVATGAHRGGVVVKNRTLGPSSPAACWSRRSLAFFVSPHASSSPDGLERVAIDQGFIDTATDHAMADAPLADYGVRGVDDPGLSTGLAGVIGVAVCFALGSAFVLVVRRRSSHDGRRGRSRHERRAHPPVLRPRATRRCTVWRPRRRSLATVAVRVRGRGHPARGVLGLRRSTPRSIAGAALVAHIPLRHLATRLLVELPVPRLRVLPPVRRARPAGRGARPLAVGGRACGGRGTSSSRARSASPPPSCSPRPPASPS